MHPSLLGYFLALMAAVTWAVAPVLYRRGGPHILLRPRCPACNGYITSAALSSSSPWDPRPSPLPAATMAKIFVCSVLCLSWGTFLLRVPSQTWGIHIGARHVLLPPDGGARRLIFLGEPAKPMVFMRPRSSWPASPALAPQAGPKRQTTGPQRTGGSFLAMSCWTFG